MREEINNWMNSLKFKELNAKLEEKKKELSSLTFTIPLVNIHNLMEKTELIKLIDDCFKYQNLTDLQKFELDKKTQVDKYYINSSFDELLQDYIRDICIWGTNLQMYITTEEYELCADIRDCMQFEEKEFIRLIGYYTMPEDATIEYMDEVFNLIVNVIPKVQEQYKLC